MVQLTNDNNQIANKPGRVFNEVNTCCIFVCGSREFENENIVKNTVKQAVELALKNYIKVYVYHGGARGVDTFASQVVNDMLDSMPRLKRRLFEVELKPNWQSSSGALNKAAGIVRNVELINKVFETKNADFTFFAFWDGKSKGTLHAIETYYQVASSLRHFVKMIITLPSEVVITQTVKPKTPLIFTSQYTSLGPNKKPALHYYSEGDLFSSNAQAFVNPVNLTPYWAAGLAKVFNDRFELPYPVDYTESEIRDIPIIHRMGAEIVCIPTRIHYRDKYSDIDLIKESFVKAMHKLKDKNISSVALPHLGCGIGGLDWQEVRRELCSLAIPTGIDIVFYDGVF